MTDEEFAAFLMNWTGGLTEDQRSVVALSVFHKNTVPQIAGLLDRPEAVVARELTAAMNRLRQLMESNPELAQVLPRLRQRRDARRGSGTGKSTEDP